MGRNLTEKNKTEIAKELEETFQEIKEESQNIIRASENNVMILHGLEYGLLLGIFGGLIATITFDLFIKNLSFLWKINILLWGMVLI